MHKEGDEVHMDEVEARSGSTPHIVRYILGISLALVIVALSAIWITGALSTTSEREQPVEPETGIGQAAGNSDGLNSGEDFVFEAEPVEAGEGSQASRTVPNPATE